MSDETAKEVTPLRLKRPSAPAPAPMPAPDASIEPGAPAVVPAPENVSSAGESQAVPSRRRPTLAADPISVPPVDAEPPAPPLPPSAPPPPLFLDETPASSGGEAQAPVKLRVGSKPPPSIPPSALADGAAAPDDLFPPGSGAPLMPLPGLPSPGMPPPPPHARAHGGAAGRPPGTVPIATEGTAPTGVNPLMPLPISPGTRPPMPLPLPPQAGAGRTAEKSHKPKRDLVVFLFGFLLLAGVGVGAYFFFTRSEVADEVTAQVKGKLEQAAELPGKVVANAKDNLAQARGSEQQRVDAITEGAEAPARTGVGAVTPAELESRLNKPGPVVSTETPASTENVQAYSGHSGVVTTPVKTEPAPPPPPSARLQRYAEGLSVSGVFQGTPARALVNGRLIRSGEVIEPNLGVTFVGVEPEARQLILQEQSGAQVRVRY